VSLKVSIWLRNCKRHAVLHCAHLRAPARTQHIVDYYVPRTSSSFDHLVNKNNIEREILLVIFLIILLFCFDAFYSFTQKIRKVLTDVIRRYPMNMNTFVIEITTFCFYWIKWDNYCARTNKTCAALEVRGSAHCQALQQI